MSEPKRVLQADLVSVIVPVYRAETYLCQCLDSICGQSYRKLEIVLVDDGSPDLSGAICDEYAAKDERITVLHQENAGISQTRNAGLSVATGEYVLFVDSDDWIEAETCEVAVAAAKAQQADVVFWNYYREYGDKQLTRKLLPNTDIVFDKAECAELRRRLVGPVGKELARPEQLDTLSTVWGKLYRRDCIEESTASFVDLKEIGTCEDGLFNAEVFSTIEKAVYIDRCLYHYRRTNENSFTTGYKAALWEQWKRLYDRFGEICPEESAALKNRISLNLIGLGMNISASGLTAKEKRVALKEILASGRYRSAVGQLDISPMPIYWKVFFLCAKWRWSGGVLLLCRVIDWMRKMK